MAELTLRNMNNDEVGKIELPDDVFGVPEHQDLVFRAIIQHRNNARQGTVASRNRRFVRGGGAKPWRQKKTGRARHGSRRSPLWRGGGTVHGPQPRDYSERLPKKMRQGAIRVVLSSKLRENRLIVLDSIQLEQPRTKLLVAGLKRLGIEGSALLVDSHENMNLRRAANNIPGVDSADRAGINVYDLVRHEYLLISEPMVRTVAEDLA